MNLIVSSHKLKHNEEHKTQQQQHYSNGTISQSPLTAVTCNECIKHQKELEQLIYLKHQIDQQYQEEKLKNNLLTKQKNDITQQYHNLHSKHQQLQTQFQFKTSEINELSSIINTLRSKQQQQPQQYQQQQSQTFPNNNTSSSNSNELLSTYKTQLDFYSQRNCELESKVTSLLTELTKTKKHFDTLKNTNLLLTAKQTNEAQQTQNKYSSFTQIQTQNEYLQSQIQSLTSRLNEQTTLNTSHTNTITQLQNKLNTLTKAFNENEHKYNQLQLQNESLSFQNKTLLHSLSTYENEISYLKQQTQFKQNNINQQIGDITLLQHENSEMKNALAQFQLKINELSAYVTTSDETTAKMSLVKNENILLQFKSEALLNEIKRITNENIFLKQHYLHNNNNHSNTTNTNDNKPILVIKELSKIDINNYESALQETQIQNKQLENDIMNANDTISKLKQEVNEHRNTIKMLNVTKCEQDITINTLQQQLCMLNKENIINKCNNTSIREENISLQTNNTSLSNELQHNKQTIQTQQYANKLLEKVNNTKEEMILKLSSKIFQQEKQITLLEQDIASLTTSLQDKDKQITKLRKDKDVLYNIIHKKGYK
jgi:chromosome segregation ATPase